MPGLRAKERVHLRLRLLREGLRMLEVSARLLEAPQRVVIGALLRLMRHSEVVPIVAVPPGVLEVEAEIVARPPPERDVSVRVGKLAAQIIELRLEFSDSALQSGVFDDPGVKKLRELLARELGAFQERQRQ